MLKRLKLINKIEKFHTNMHFKEGKNGIKGI